MRLFICAHDKLRNVEYELIEEERAIIVSDIVFSIKQNN